MTRLLLSSVLLMLCFGLQAQNKNSVTEQYIQTYAKIAIEQERTYGIPASITLAQGVLESGSGRSMLAVKGNNHFGIKCHNDWEGERIYKDDDAKNECFRVYASPEQSYVDHSLFLVEKKRYADLFKLDVDDYKGWAKGLKKAGYATNPKYPQLLIDIIELYDLDKISSENGEWFAKGDEMKTPTKEEMVGKDESVGEKQLATKERKPFFERLFGKTKWYQSYKQNKKDRKKRAMERELQKMIDRQDVNRTDFEVDFE